MTRPIPAGEFTAAETALDDCWKRIGIRGDKSCPELKLHSHCRDCPTFSLSAAALLDRVPIGAETDGSTSQASLGSLAAEAGAASDTESAVIFRLGQEWFALPVRLLDEIVGPRRIHSLPHRKNPALLGLVNVRGELVICVSVAPLLVGTGQDPAASRFVIVRHPGGRFACPVDEVQHTHHYSPAELEAVPATVGRSASSLTSGLLRWQGRTVARLDEQLLLDALGRSLGA